MPQLSSPRDSLGNTRILRGSVSLFSIQWRQLGQWMKNSQAHDVEASKESSAQPTASEGKCVPATAIRYAGNLRLALPSL